jgi:hypothetical protein
MARDKVWPRTWNTYSELPGYQIKFNVDTASGLVFGFLVALTSESDPDSNHVHYWYERNTGNTGYQMKSGNTRFSSSFADHIISDIQQKLPSLLMK